MLVKILCDQITVLDGVMLNFRLESLFTHKVDSVRQWNTSQEYAKKKLVRRTRTNPNQYY